jgi:hypothetical protein
MLASAKTTRDPALSPVRAGWFAFPLAPDVPAWAVEPRDEHRTVAKTAAQHGPAVKGGPWCSHPYRRFIAARFEARPLGSDALPILTLR